MSGRLKLPWGALIFRGHPEEEGGSSASVQALLPGREDPDSSGCVTLQNESHASSLRCSVYLENDPVRMSLLLRGNHLQTLASEGLSCSQTFQWQAVFFLFWALRLITGAGGKDQEGKPPFRSLDLSAARRLSPSSLSAISHQGVPLRAACLAVVQGCRQLGVSYILGWEWPAE